MRRQSLDAFDVDVSRVVQRSICPCVRILLTWELGGGLGHLMNLRPLAQELAARRHQVFVAARDLSLGPRVFDVLPVVLLPAPWKSRPTEQVSPVATYADLLLNIGCGDADCLTAQLQAWRNLFGLVQPDLLVCDHSPTALLAARAPSPRPSPRGRGRGQSDFRWRQWAPVFSRRSTKRRCGC